MTTNDLTGRCAVVTGASTGIGQATCVALAEAGADIVGISRRPAVETETAVHGAGRQALMITGSTEDRETVDDLAARAIERFGRIDVWVNNASGLTVSPLVETTDEAWHGLLAANLHGYFYGCRAAARQMLAQRAGRIVNVTTVASILAVGGGSAYIAGKGAITALTRVLALELARANVTVNAVAPGAIETEMTRPAYTPEVRSAYERRIPVGRIGTPRDVAEVIAFLASDAASYVTAQELIVDGGWTATGELLLSGESS